MQKAGMFFICAGLLGLALLLSRPAVAAWPTDPTVNVPLCTATGTQDSPSILSDGAGGAIVAWQDYRSGTSKIYAQRVNAAGVARWTAGGMALSGAASTQQSPCIVSDGVCGAIVAWHDDLGGTSRIYAQRVDSAGVLLWTASGKNLSTATGEALAPRIVSDGSGGAIVAWHDARSGDYDIYVQRILADGTVQWTANGVALCTVTGTQCYPEIVSDGAHGAIVAWIDNRNERPDRTLPDLYAGHVLANGSVDPAWPAGGRGLCITDGTWSVSGDLYAHRMVSDGGGGAIVTWMDERSGNVDIYAQRILAGGGVRWAANGIALCTAVNNQGYPRIVSDAAGGGIVVWSDYRGGFDFYAQRVDSAGASRWTPDGIALSIASSDGSAAVITPDGARGVIVTWVGSDDLLAQRVDATGASRWTTTLCNAAGTRNGPTSGPDGAGGAIVAWRDQRNDGGDIYAQRVQSNGQLGGTVDVPAEATLAFALDPVRPNPSRGGALTVHFSLPSAAPARLELLDVAGRRIAAREVGSLGAGRHAVALADDVRLAPGIFFARLRQGANIRTLRLAVLE